jgi:hypothetical protein
MGAYENPRFFNAPNYMAGTQAFLKTFTKGLEEGVAEGEKMIAERKEYEKGIYEKGEELQQSLDAALGNTTDAKSKIQASLRQFYDEALAVDMPTKKGLGGLFAKAQERRLGDLDLIEAQNSFTDATTGINTAFNYVYDPETDIMENEDRGHEQYKIKKAIHDQIKNGSAGTNFDYANGKFTGGITIKLKDDKTGEMKDEFISTARMQAIFTASGKEQRDIIDAKHDETTEAIFTESQAEVNNIIERAKLGTDDKYADASVEVEKIARRKLGIAEDGSMSQMSRKFINDEYNNHANINASNKTSLMTDAVGDLIKDPNEIQRLINEPFDIGMDTYVKRYGAENAEAIKNAVERGKGEIVLASYMEEMKGRGLMDKSFDYKAPVDTNQPKKTDTTNEDAYFRQIAVNETAPVINKVLDTQELGRFMGTQMGPLQSNDPLSDNPTVTSTPLPDKITFKDGTLVNLAADQIDERTQGILTEYGNAFLNKKFSFRGSTESASGLEINNNGDITILFDGKQIMQPQYNAEGTKIGETPIRLEDSTLKFNIYDPNRMRTYFNAISTEKGGSGKNAMMGYSTQYDKNMVSEYTTPAGLNRLNQPKMGKWIEFVATGNNGQVAGGAAPIFDYIKQVGDDALSKEMKAFKTKYIDAYNKYHGIEEPANNSSLPIFNN